jgi:hypothetical protein
MDQGHQLLSTVLQALNFNAIADCLENQFTHNDLYDENHERRVKAREQALLEVADNNKTM